MTIRRVFSIHWIKHYWVAVLIWVFVVIPTLSFALVSLLFIAYLYWPKDYSAIDFSRFATTDDHVVVLAHGVKDDPSTWIQPLAQRYRSKGYGGQVLGVNWSDYARDTLRCAIDGQRIGKKIGATIAENSALDSVHLIAHSCGAFVILSACREIKARRGDVAVQTTYLDPVSVYGLWWNYGLRHFGTCADYAEAYIDTGDSVPGSNQLIPNTHTYNVTAARLSSDYDSIPHNWPIVYYRQLVESGNFPRYHIDNELLDQKPRGELQVVE